MPIFDQAEFDIRCEWGNLSPEARAARTAFLDAQAEIPALLRQSMSGKQLIEGDWRAAWTWRPT